MGAKIKISDISSDVNKISVFYDKNDVRKIKCFCGAYCDRSIIPHMKKIHSKKWKKWCFDFVRLRNKGWSNRRIMWKYRAIFSWTVIEREIKKMVGEGKAALKVPQKEKIAKWAPPDFRFERTTIWSFPKRGDWAVHESDYRGNWPPQIPRNLILRYSREGGTVLDPFVGGGTTLIEAYLLGRKSIGIDINPRAITISDERIKELETKSKGTLDMHLNNDCRPIVKLGDARNSLEILSTFGLSANSIDLICTHPPYLDSLRYTENIDEDLSRIQDLETFCDELQKTARAIYAVLKKGGRCAVLIGDVRKKGKIIPLGLKLMERFLREKFELEEIIIKQQHKDESTEFYFNKNFVNYLIAHEYLFVFRKG
ncbi:hypothetical protein ES706_03508 [subsurface metagenome]